MRFSFRWLGEFVDIPCTPQELSKRFPAIGFELADFYYRARKIDDGIIVGKVISREKHPQADKLSLCQVDTGKEKLQIVCGAGNVDAGQLIPLATLGSLINGEFQIKKAKLRGIESFGMICSARELAISNEHEGILVLPDDLEIGIPVNRLPYFDDYVFELEIPANRGDALCILGIAREIAALYNTRVKLPSMADRVFEGRMESAVSIQIEDEEGCPRYVGQVIRQVKNGPSPFWLRDRLEIAGQRSISAVVDITNLIMLELGQPLHAFDFDKLPAGQIGVRRSRSGDCLETIDHVQRSLPEDVLLITDQDQPIAIAGIMGGIATEIDSSTTNIFLESAFFNPQIIYRGQKKAQLRTEASNRFFRGANPEITRIASNYACALLEQLTHAQVSSAPIDQHPRPSQRVSIAITQTNIQRHLGVAISFDQVKSLFIPLGLGLIEENETRLVFEIPGYRPDLMREIDLIEEVARLVGLDNIPTATRFQGFFQQQPKKRSNHLLAQQIRRYFVGRGFYDLVLMPLENSAQSEFFAPAAEAVVLMNPLSRDLEILRQSLLPGVLRAMAYNLNRNQPFVKTYAWGKIFHKKTGDQVLAEETHQLVIALSEYKNDAYWQSDTPQLDFAYLQGIARDFLQYLKWNDFEIVPSSLPFYTGPVQGILRNNQGDFGHLGMLTSQVLDAFSLKKNVFTLALDAEKLIQKYQNRILSCEAPSKFPPVERDISLLIDLSITYQMIESTIRDVDAPLLNQIIVKDVYQGNSIPQNQRAYTLRLVYRSAERTLTDDEINATTEKIRLTLLDKFHIILR